MYLYFFFGVQGKKFMAQFSQQTMKKSVDMKSRLEEAILGGANARAEMMRRRQSANMSSMTNLSGGKWLVETSMMELLCLSDLTD